MKSEQNKFGRRVLGLGATLCLASFVIPPGDAEAFHRRFHAQFCAANTDHPGDYAVFGWEVPTKVDEGRIENRSSYETWRDRTLMCPFVTDHHLWQSHVTQAVVHGWDDSDQHEVVAWACVADYFGWETRCSAASSHRRSSSDTGGSTTNVSYTGLFAIALDLTQFHLDSASAIDGWLWERSYPMIVIQIPNGQAGQEDENNTRIAGYTLCSQEGDGCNVLFPE